MKTKEQSTGSVLVLTDFSSIAKHADGYATALAAQVRANVLLFHAYLIPGVGFDS